MPWFAKLRRTAGNFAFGLTRIKSRRIIAGLQRIALAGQGGTRRRRQQHRIAAGFGSPEENRRVERAAVEAVTRHYREQGWVVRSCEALLLGYDLLCTRNGIEHHVEVKGVRGSICQFPITANERQAAEIDRAFRLFALTNALDRQKQRLLSFTGRRLLQEFEFQPISFMVKRRRRSNQRLRPTAAGDATSRKRA
jgi:hypothetical protein